MNINEQRLKSFLVSRGKSKVIYFLNIKLMKSDEKEMGLWHRQWQI